RGRARRPHSQRRGGTPAYRGRARPSLRGADRLAGERSRTPPATLSRHSRVHPGPDPPPYLASSLTAAPARPPDVLRAKSATTAGEEISESPPPRARAGQGRARGDWSRRAPRPHARGGVRVLARAAAPPRRRRPSRRGTSRGAGERSLRTR